MNARLEIPKRFGLLILVSLGLSALCNAQTLRSDFNSDGTVDFSDFIAFAQAYGKSDSQFDLNGNNIVDFPDFLLFVSDFSTTPAPNWEEITTTNTPPGRFDHTLVLDPEQSQLVLFGGKSGVPLDDTWVLDLSTLAWTQITASPSPSARRGQAAIYDSSRKRMIIFGGESPTRTFFNDIWAFDLTAKTWSEITPVGVRPTLPLARYGTSAIYDPSRDRMIISHGFSSDGRYDDTWAFDFARNEWTDLTPSGTKPLKRCLHDAVLDATNNRMLLGWGCSSGFGPCPQGDLWSFDLSTQTWTELSPEGDKPGALSNTRLIFDVTNKRTTLFGGADVRGTQDTWHFNIETQTWEKPSFQGSLPPVRWSHDLVIDTSANRLLMWGGTNGAIVLADLWALQF